METRISSLQQYLGRPFKLLDDSNSRWLLILFCTVFSTVFILFYDPLNVSGISKETTLARLFSYHGLSFWGALVLIFTQFVLRPRFQLDTFLVWQYLLWVMLEIFLLSVCFFLIYRALEEPLLSEFIAVFRMTALLAIVPYAIACLLIAVVRMPQKNQVEPVVPEPANALLSIKDENGKPMLSIAQADILLLKSENNYTAIFFRQEEKVEKKLIRSSLKNILQQLPSAHFLRIHRSYSINVNNLSAVDRKNGELQVKVKQLPDLSLKVSETYKADILRLMDN
ncbi:MAG: LytTR family transcriptional regulator [Saprospiraceae bacterium]|nr:LytTR family transcriptional regulator [Saprospiraceae bacterium]